MCITKSSLAGRHAHLGMSTQEDGLESSGSSTSSGGLIAGSKSSNRLPPLRSAPSTRTAYLRVRAAPA